MAEIRGERGSAGRAAPWGRGGGGEVSGGQGRPTGMETPTHTHTHHRGPPGRWGRGPPYMMKEIKLPPSPQKKLHPLCPPPCPGPLSPPPPDGLGGFWGGGRGERVISALPPPQCLASHSHSVSPLLRRAELLLGEGGAGERGGQAAGQQ